MYYVGKKYEKWTAKTAIWSSYNSKINFVPQFVCYKIHWVNLPLFMNEESHIDLKTEEVKLKDEKIAEKEKIIKEKSDTLASLRNEMASLQVSNFNFWAKHFVNVLTCYLIYNFTQWCSTLTTSFGCIVSQKKGTFDAEKQLAKAHARANDLEKQVSYG